jgi:hypothetical protein
MATVNRRCKLAGAFEIHRATYSANNERGKREQPDHHAQNHEAAANFLENGLLAALVLLAADLDHLRPTLVVAKALTESRDTSEFQEGMEVRRTGRTLGRMMVAVMASSLLADRGAAPSGESEATDQAPRIETANYFGGWSPDERTRCQLLLGFRRSCGGISEEGREMQEDKHKMEKSVRRRESTS